MTQQDDITQRLRDNADLDEAEHGNARVVQMEREAADEIERLRAELSQVRAPVADERAALADLLDYVDSNTCIHESTHRGGAIWTICDGCGAKWADDEGGFVPHQDAPAVAAARAALASAPVAGEAQKPVAWFIDWPDEPELGHYIAESPADSGRNRPLVFADASPQESTPVPEEPVYAYRRKGLDDFVTCDRERFDELSAKPRLFETRIFYAAPQDSAPVAGEAQPVACLRRQIDGSDWGHWKPGSVEDGQRVTGLRSWQVRWLVDAAPQASAEPQQYTHSEVFGPMESAWNAALDQAAAVAKRISDKYAFGHYGNETDTADEIEREILALKQPQADKDGGQQLRWRVTDDMRYAVRFAPSSAHWSERLKEFFGPDAREGIDALERQLREAHAMLDRQPKLRADASAVRRALIAASNYIDTLGGDSKSYRAALYATQAEQGERDA